VPSLFIKKSRGFLFCFYSQISSKGYVGIIMKNSYKLIQDAGLAIGQPIVSHLVLGKLKSKSRYLLTQLDAQIHVFEPQDKRWSQYEWNQRTATRATAALGGNPFMIIFNFVKLKFIYFNLYLYFHHTYQEWVNCHNM
jgi:hypothetical protein